MSEWVDLHAARALWKAGDVSLWEWLRTWWTVDERSWFAWDDPRPTISLLRELGKPIARRLRRPGKGVH